MRVYLIRHGEAISPGMRYEEEDRPLTVEGRAQVRRTAAAWAQRGEQVPEAWIVSPYVRATQTAEILATAFGTDAGVEMTRSLVPEGRVSVVQDLIAGRAEEAIALVGHQPLMGGVAAYLLGWSTVPAQLEPGAILAIDLPGDGPGTLAWHAITARDERGPLFLEPGERA